MADLEQVRLLRQDTIDWNKWRRRFSQSIPDLSGANLQGKDLSGADLRRAELSGSDLTRTSLQNADLYGSSLVGANLSRANLSNVNLQSANLSLAKLDSTNMDMARLGGTGFGSNDLSTVKSLDTVSHAGPSYLDLRTIYRSLNNLSLNFLRGTGLSDLDIKTVRLYQSGLTSEQITTIIYQIIEERTGGGIQYRSTFISFEVGDQKLADFLYDDLQKSGVRCWYASHNLSKEVNSRLGTDKAIWREEEAPRLGIDEAIWRHEKLLLILSKGSIQSERIEHEVETALRKEKETHQEVLFPVRLDEAIESIKVGWPARIWNSRNVGDFRNWRDHDEYQKAFQVLLRDLKAEHK